MLNKNVIEIDHVSFSFAEIPVLRDISIQIKEGEFIGLVGPNGGGKSTLVRLVAGLLEPNSGSIKVLGGSPQQARSRIGYVPQYAAFSRNFPITVKQVVLMGRLKRWWGHYKRVDYEVVENALRETEIFHLADRPIGMLSGGELQRVMIARALAADPQILLLDEPTANIDMRVENEIFDLLKLLNKRMTVIVVSHDIGFISAYVSRVACLNQTLICHETEALNSETITALYGDNVHHIAHNH